MRCLICFEWSGVMRDAFAALGWDAWSCDLLPTASPGQHFQCNYREVIGQDWDFVGYHPDCRVMANSGVRWLTNNPARWHELKASAAMFQSCLNDPRPGYVENSIMHKHARALISRRQDQVVQPWHHGEPFFKGTALWLRGLPLLQDSNRLTPPAKGTPEHKAWSMVHTASPGPDRWKVRSRTFPGVARAVAIQYTKYLTR